VWLYGGSPAAPGRLPDSTSSLTELRRKIPMDRNSRDESDLRWSSIKLFGDLESITKLAVNCKLDSKPQVDSKVSHG
jgi:hypothetical protein